MPDLKLTGSAELGGKGAGWVTLSPDSKSAYVANPVTNDVSVVDVASMKEVTRIPVGFVPKRNATVTSLVVDPPDGRIPDLTAEARARQQARGRGARYDDVEDRPLAERCILGFNSGPPMVPSAYNNNVQIVQTRDHVVILNEMIHSARIVDLTRRTDNRPD